MLQVLRDQVLNTIIHLTSDFFKDLHWFRTFLKQYNGVTMYEVRPISADIYLDASQGLAEHLVILNICFIYQKIFTIIIFVQLEILNSVVALKIWGQLWQNKRIRIYCDNHAVVDALNSGKAFDPGHLCQQYMVVSCFV